MESLSTGHWLADENGDVVHARLLPDVRLTVSGDFETPEKKIAAARFIAHCLNVAIDGDPADELAEERIYVDHKGVSATPTADSVAYVRADIARALSQTTGQLAETINRLVLERQQERERVTEALEAAAHIAVMPNECHGLPPDRCYETGARQGGTAVRLAIKDAVAKVFTKEE